MYSVHNVMLGETPAPSSPSLWDSFSNLVSTGVNAGFNMYNKVQQVKIQQQQTAAVQNMARQYGTMAYTQPMTGVQPGMIAYSPYQSSGGGGLLSGWTLPVIVGGGALVLILALRK